jgi:HEXXH motif-containing protein
MNPPYHQLSSEVFAALASGGGGAEAVEELAEAQYSKHLILLAGVLDAAKNGEQRRLAKIGLEILDAARRENRSATEKVIRYPSVGIWAWRTIQACRGGPALPGTDPAGLLVVAAAAAIRAGLTVDIEAPATDGQILLPSLGVARVPGSTALIRVANNRAMVGPIEVPSDPYQVAAGWRGPHRVRIGAFDVLVDDLDGFWFPDIPDLASSQAIMSWEAALSEAWHLLEAHHPNTAEEVAAGVSVIVPRPAPRSGAVSTTSPQVFGTIGMSLPKNPSAGAEALAHEIQHLKLGALQHIVELTLPDDGRRYYAPWRDDPRPLNGLLQGTYAYLGVAGFLRRQREIDGAPQQTDAEYARWRAATELGAATLRSSGRLTTAGTKFVDGMARTLISWRGDRVPVHAVAQAGRAAEAHLNRWESVNGHLPVRLTTSDGRRIEVEVQPTPSRGDDYVRVI